MTDDSEEIKAIRTRKPGKDPENPYSDIDIHSLPIWWQDAIVEHREYGLRPYRPPRFADGALLHSVIKEFEAEIDRSISIRGINVSVDEDWAVFVDNEVKMFVSRRRSPKGYTVYQLTSDEFRHRLNEAINTDLD